MIELYIKTRLLEINAKPIGKKREKKKENITKSANCRVKILECKPSRKKLGLFEINFLPDPFLYGTITHTCFQK